MTTPAQFARVRYLGSEPISVRLVTDTEYRFDPGSDPRVIDPTDAELLDEMDDFDVQWGPEESVH